MSTGREAAFLGAAETQAPHWLGPSHQGFQPPENVVPPAWPELHPSPRRGLGLTGEQGRQSRSVGNGQQGSAWVSESGDPQ